MLEEAFRDERDARSIIQVKARGIEDYPLPMGVGEGRR
jgi:hypothetical protein